MGSGLSFPDRGFGEQGPRGRIRNFLLRVSRAPPRGTGGGLERCTFAVPGNHDVDISINQALDRQEIADPNKQYFDADENGLRLRAILLPRFKAFAENDFSAPGGEWINSQAGVFQTIADVKGVRVGIIGVNTAWLSKGDSERELLTPGASLLERALASLEGCQLRLVLGHHPLDWLLPKERNKIKSLLGQASAVYLHGHLHDVWAEPSYGSGYDFLTVQSGAAFQARADEIWRNGIVFGEADVEKKVLRLQPWVWNNDHNGWVLEADAFPDVHRRSDWWEYALPGARPERNAAPVSQPEVAPPDGWTVSTLDQLRAHCAPLDPDMAISFFDGAAPGWHVALSPSTPRRMIVKSLIGRFVNSDEDEKPRIVRLLAASCEGKTTALLQAAYGVLEQRPDWKILRRTDETRSVDPARLTPILSSGGDWLLVIDEADYKAGRGLIELLSQAPASMRRRLHVLLACRDSDWYSSGADTLDWATAGTLVPENLKGLEEQEAEDITRAWQQFGERGLGKLSSVPEDMRAAELLGAARREAKVAKGAFFGALLTVRFGEDLEAHARDMMKRLEQRQISGGGLSLQKAATFIAAMHAEEMEFLSRPVLAFALGCPIPNLQKKVLRPLGAEAVSTWTSDFVFTRHLRIAKALLKVSVEDFGEDADSLYVQLAEAAIAAVKADVFVPPNADRWRHKLPRHFFESGRRPLGIKIAEALYRREKPDCHRIVELARYYREAGDARKAVAQFESFAHKTDRAFFYEWGASAGNDKDYASNVLLAAYSLADQHPNEKLNVERSKLSLTGIAIAFGKLYDEYRERVFADGRAAAAVAATAILGSDLESDSKADFLKRHSSKNKSSGAKAPASEEATQQLQKSVIVASDYVRSDAVKARVSDVRGLSFEQLYNLIRKSTNRT